MFKSVTNSAGGLFKGEMVIWMVYFILCMVSLVEVHSASSRMTFAEGASHWGPLVNQMVYLGAGFLVVLVVHRFPCKVFNLLTPLLFALSFGLLLVASLRGGTSLNGTHRWIRIAGFTLQPSEFVKMSLIMWTALVLARTQAVVKTAGGKVMVGAVKGKPYTAFMWIGIPLVLCCGLIFMDNISTAAMLFLVIVLMMILGHVPWKYLLRGAGCLLMLAGVVMTIAFITPKEALESNNALKRLATLKGRIERHGGDDKIVFGSADWKKQVLEDKNSQSTYAKIAIANSNGIGLGPGNSVERDFLQHAESDFIYAIIVEETGIIGGLVIMLLYMILLLKTSWIAQKCRRFFPAYLVIGFGLMMAVQALVNMAVAVGAMPVTGQTLPFISRGGTSILVTSFYIAVILSVSRYAEAADLADKTSEPMLEGETNEFASEGNMV